VEMTQQMGLGKVVLAEGDLGKNRKRGDFHTFPTALFPLQVPGFYIDFLARGLVFA